MLTGYPVYPRQTSYYTSPELQPVQSHLTSLLVATQIDVSDNGIDQATSLKLIAAMKAKSMVSIGMASCNLGVEGAKVVAEMASVMGSLTQVLAFRKC